MGKDERKPFVVSPCTANGSEARVTHMMTHRATHEPACARVATASLSMRGGSSHQRQHNV